MSILTILARDKTTLECTHRGCYEMDNVQSLNFIQLSKLCTPSSNGVNIGR